ncbi:aldo/keto reductase [Corallococcus coralloides]|uniref:Aldo/keto reductase n=2 Tax=Corallococcus coralloides TaxID=184914 RepID=A0A410RI91_CORCK|nr:aldo/keto reductase [Corallococcus coralloides]
MHRTSRGAAFTSTQGDTHIHYRPLGRTGLFVSELCFGAMTFGGEGSWKNIGQQGQAEADALVGRCLAASELRLSPEQLSKLDAVSKLPPEYPGWMVERQNADRFPPAR